LHTFFLFNFRVDDLKILDFSYKCMVFTPFAWSKGIEALFELFARMAGGVPAVRDELGDGPDSLVSAIEFGAL